MATLTVVTDSRIHMLSALLAATDWPDREQRPVPRGVHPLAALLKKVVSPYRSHAAAQYLQSIIATNDDLAPLYVRALSEDQTLTGYLRAFAGAAGLAAFWSEQKPVWDQSVREVQSQVQGVDFEGFLKELFETPPSELIIHPNIAYPTTTSLGVLVDNKAYSIMPPRKAVGESKPWPFGDDRDYVVRLALHDFVQATLTHMVNQHSDLIPIGENDDLLPDAFRAEFPGWRKQIIELFAYAAQIIFLNRLDDGAGDAFAVFERRTRKLVILPDVVNEVSNYIAGKGLSPRYASLETYLPHFADQVDGLLYDSKA